jgi:hypothetical protein
MAHPLVFLLTISAALGFAQSRLVFRIFDYLFPANESDDRKPPLARAPLAEPSEVTNEIRRVTAVLEASHRTANRAR